MSKDLGNTTDKNQELLIKYVSQLITEDDMEPRVVDSGKGRHLRTEIRKDPIIYLNGLTNGLFKKELTIAEKEISGTFPTYILETNKNVTIQKSKNNFETIPKGTKIYFVNTVHTNDKAKFNKNSKALTPAKFNFSGSTIKENFLKGKILRAFSSVRALWDVDFKIEFFCSELVKYIDKYPPGNDIPLKFSQIKNLKSKSEQELISEINNSDINVIAKNFGEILGSLWYMRIDPENNSVYYPIKENQPVIDYKVHTYNTNRVITSTKPISAKSGSGAASAISGLYLDEKQDLDYNISTIENTEPSNSEEKTLKDFLIKTKNKTIPQKILSINEEILKHKKPYSLLASNIVGEVTLTSINNFLHTIKDYDDASEKLKDFFDSCEYDYKKPEKERILSEIFSKKSGSRLGAVIYPLGVYAAKEMNKNKDWLNFLNKIIKGKKIIQVNIYLTKKDIRFTKNDINDPDSKKSYEFVYNGMARDENNRGMSFKLKG
jgi:hypothetical protein